MISTDDDLAYMAKALGHPTRVHILRLLTARDTCVTGDLVEELPLAQSTVSEHLRILPRGRARPGRDRRPPNPLLHQPRATHRPQDSSRVTLIPDVPNPTAAKETADAELDNR